MYLRALGQLPRSLNPLLSENSLRRLQMLVNLIMDNFAALALATEPPHWDVMKRPPRDPHDFILTKAMTKNILTVASAFLIFFVGLLIYIQRDGVVSTHELTIFFYDIRDVSVLEYV